PGYCVQPVRDERARKRLYGTGAAQLATVRVLRRAAAHAGISVAVASRPGAEPHHAGTPVRAHRPQPRRADLQLLGSAREVLQTAAEVLQERPALLAQQHPA